MGWLTHVPNDGPHKEGPQWAALKQADRHPLVREADWVLYLRHRRVREHPCRRAAAGGLLAALPEATAIAVDLAVVRQCRGGAL
jgi:hypothetical protein